MTPSNNENSDNNSHYSKDLESGKNGLSRSTADATISLKEEPTDNISNDSTSASVTNSNSRTTKSQRESVLVRIDSSLLEMASSVKDEYDRRAEVDEEDRRKAELCCFFCCDLVRACIVVDICDIVIAILLIVASVLNSTSDGFYVMMNFGTIMRPSGDDFVVIDDDELLELRQNKENSAFYVTILMGVGVLFSVIGIVGSLRFQKYMVLVTGIWYCVDVLLSAIMFQWHNVVVAVFFAYPHFALYHALRKGKITRDNYEATEKHCCCECCERY